MVQFYDNKREYDRVRTQQHYRPLYKARHDKAFYQRQYDDPDAKLRCSLCEQYKRPSEFTRDPYNARGFMSRCMPCRTATMRYTEHGSEHKFREGYVYIIQLGDYYKIGRAKDVEERIKSMFSIKLPYEIKLVMTIPAKDSAVLERHLHSQFYEHRLEGEWFSPHPDLLNYIAEWQKAGEK